MVIDIKMCRFDNVPWGFRLVGFAYSHIIAPRARGRGSGTGRGKKRHLWHMRKAVDQLCYVFVSQLNNLGVKGQR